MKTSKNKIVFGGVLLVILLFLVGYTYQILGDNLEAQTLSAPTLPRWEESGESFETKKEAVDAIRDEREKHLPSPYPDHMIDEKGYFNPDYMELEKNRIIDSIYDQEDFRISAPSTSVESSESRALKYEGNMSSQVLTSATTSEELGLEHQLFFASHSGGRNSKVIATAQILGTHTLRKDSRVPLKIARNAGDNQKRVSVDMVAWGRISFGANRVYITLSELGGKPVALEAYDLQDGLRGIYLENSFRAEATSEVLRDAASSINVPGLPQVRGLKNVFRRRQQNIKVTLLDGHTFYLKSKQ